MPRPHRGFCFPENSVPKSKQEKQKERERRVAKAKLEATAQKRAEEKAADESKKPLSRKAKVMTAGIVPVATANPANPATRRIGG